jgi:hypothetical protein
MSGAADSFGMSFAQRSLVLVLHVRLLADRNISAIYTFKKLKEKKTYCFFVHFSDGKQIE